MSVCWLEGRERKRDMDKEDINRVVHNDDYTRKD